MILQKGGYILIMEHQYNYKAGKNYKPTPLEDSTFYFFKGYLIRISKDKKDIWVYNRLSYISSHTSDPLEKGMEEVYNLIEIKMSQEAILQKKKLKEEEIQEKLKPYMDAIIKALT